MINSIVTEGQSLLDLALQELGTVASLFELADANGLAITDALAPNQAIAVPTATSSRPDVVAGLAGQRINTGDEAPPVPATRQHYFSSLFFNPDYFA